MWLHENRLGNGQTLTMTRSPSQRLPRIQIALMTAGCRVDIEPDTVVLVLTLNGQATVDAADGRAILSPRGFQVCDPSAKIEVSADERGLVLVMSFSAAALRRLDTYASHTPLPGRGRLDAGAARTVCAALRAAEAPTASFPLRELAIRALLKQLSRVQVELRECLASCPGKSHWRKTQVMVRMQRARRFMEVNCDRAVRISELAAMTSFSTWYFSKTFHRVYGESPKAYATGVRLERARRMLDRCDSAVGEVAAACGFESHSAFSRAYRQHFGMSAIDSRSRFATKVSIPTRLVKTTAMNREAHSPSNL